MRLLITSSPNFLCPGYHSSERMQIKVSSACSCSTQPCSATWFQTQFPLSITSCLAEGMCGLCEALIWGLVQLELYDPHIPRPREQGCLHLFSTCGQTWGSNSWPRPGPPASHWAIPQLPVFCQRNSIGQDTMLGSGCFCHSQ